MLAGLVPDQQAAWCQGELEHVRECVAVYCNKGNPPPPSSLRTGKGPPPTTSWYEYKGKGKAQLPLSKGGYQCTGKGDVAASLPSPKTGKGTCDEEAKPCSSSTSKSSLSSLSDMSEHQ